jgi:hypothetical protein
MTLKEADELALKVAELRASIKPLKAEEESITKHIKTSGFTQGDHFKITTSVTKKVDWEAIARELSVAFNVTVADFEAAVVEHTKESEVLKLGVM